MKKFLLNLLIPLLTFAIGVGTYTSVSPNVSIETLAGYTSFYDGRDVEIETYAQLASYDENIWYIGDYSEKKGVLTYLDLEKNAINLDYLHSQLRENLSEQNFKRVKILVKGKVKDNCRMDRSEGSKISFGCCFGKSITIQAKEVIQLEPVEDYTRPNSQFVD